VNGYEQVLADEAIGWRTHLGDIRWRYAIVRPGRSTWRIAQWEKRLPESFRGEKRFRSVVPFPD
jgi:hypothetical protein